MRWSIIRLIWARELRDQLRDRRTLFMIAVLPLILYPVGALGLMSIAFGFRFRGQTNPIRIVGHRHLPTASPLPAATWAACTPPPPGCPLAGVERVAGALALAQSRDKYEFAPLLDPSSKSPL